MMNQRSVRRGLTLIETLTVMLIMSILMALMMPNYYHARDKGAYTGCIENLKNSATALQVYANDNDQSFPTALTDLLPNYMASVPTCPMTGTDTYSTGYSVAAVPAAFTIVCSGTNHATVGYSANQPYVTFAHGLGP